jgi:hypothetical protein
MIVSRLATTLVALALVACAGVPAKDTDAAPAPMTLEIRFDNEANERVHVYLIGEQREWLLGRVEPGATTRLSIPEASLAQGRDFLRLAVLAGERMTLRAAQDPRARSTIAQPVAAILSHQWRFAQGQLMPRMGGPRLTNR